MSVGGGAIGGVMVEVLVVVVEGGGHSVAVASVPVGEDDKRRGRGERVIVALFCSVLLCSSMSEIFRSWIQICMNGGIYVRT